MSIAPRKGSKIASDGQYYLPDETLPEGVYYRGSKGRKAGRGDTSPKVAKAPKVTIKMADGIVDLIETLGLFVGHQPDAAERQAAIAGLMAASRKSVFVARLLAGAIDVGDYALIVVGIGGLAARIVSDVAATQDESLLNTRELVYKATAVGYNLTGGNVNEVDLHGLADLFKESEQSDGVETGRTRGADRDDGERKNVPVEKTPGDAETLRDAGNEA